MDNMIGTNNVGEVLGTNSVDEMLWSDLDEQEFLEAAMAQQIQEQALLGAAAYEAAMEQQIQEQALLGALLGAQPGVQTQTVRDKTPNKNKNKRVQTPDYKNKDGKKQSPYARGLENVSGAADFAKKIGARVVATGSAYRPSDHKPLVVVTGKGVHGIIGIVHDSVLGVSPRNLSAKQSAIVAAHNRAINLTRAAATASIKAGNKALAEGKKASVVAKKVKPVFDKLAAGKKVGVHGILGYVEEAALEAPIPDWSHPFVGVDAAGLSPGQPGYDPTTDPDSPQFGGGADLYADLYDPAYWKLPPLQPLFTDFDGDNPDPNLTVLPTGGKDLPKDLANAWFDHVPPGGITYTGDLPKDSVGSWNVFYGNGNGYLWGADKDGVGLDWWRVGEIIVKHNAFAPGRWMDEGGIIIRLDRRPGYQQDVRFAPESWGWRDAAAQSKKNGQGPLIGNPKGNLRGLQYAVLAGTWFWQSVDYAPASALTPTNAALVEANIATLNTDNAIIVAANTETMQKVKAFAEAKIKQDAANALREEQDVKDKEHTQSKTDEKKIETDEEDRRDKEKADREAAQKEADERTRQAQFEAEMQRLQHEQDERQAKFEQQYALSQQQTEAQYALAQQQMEAQYALAQQQMEAQAAPMQMQMDAQVQQAMLQMLMQSQQPQPPQGVDPSLEMLLMLMQPQGVDPSQGDPWAQPQPQGDPWAQFDPAQLPGSFDVGQLYGW